MFRPMSYCQSTLLSKFSRILGTALIAFGSGAFTSQAYAQYQPLVTPAPTVQGTSLPDAGVPSIIVPAQNSSEFFTLNQDLSVLTHSTAITSYNIACPAPSNFVASSAPSTLANDNRDAFISAKGATSGTTEVVALLPFVTSGKSCTTTAGVAFPSGVPTASFSAYDTRHFRYFVVNAFSGAVPDQIAIYATNNVDQGGGPGTITQLTRTSLDTNAQYTSVVTDATSNFGLTAITELKTATSPGNLWIYSSSLQIAVKILGPGGVPLPAINSFIIHNPNDNNGSLLVLVNQDNLTAANMSSPPLDATPFTIIDLGQLNVALPYASSDHTITLPFVTQIKATLPYYAMLGAAYNPVNHLIYAVVGGGTSTSSVFEDVVSYDPYNAASPSETVVADVSNVPLTFGSYPQLALNAASSTMQILTSNPAAVYTVGIAGIGNTAALVTGAPFPDSNLRPTAIAANPLMGETYIGSQTGQVDIITRPAGVKPQATLELRGLDFAVVDQSARSYSYGVFCNHPDFDTALGTNPVTITATPLDGSAPFTFATTTCGNSGVYQNQSISPYTYAQTLSLVATMPATTNYPAATSLPLIVRGGLGGIYPTSLSVTVPPATAAGTVNASVTFNPGTYAPTGRIQIDGVTDSSIYGTYTLPPGALKNPIVIPITVPAGSSDIKASYVNSGDTQNQASVSPAFTVVVGPATKVTPLITLAVPTTAVPAATVSGTVSLFSSSTTAPTGNVTIHAVTSGNTTPVVLTTVAASLAYASGGTSFSFTAPTAGTYSVYASYAGDAGYNTAVSSNYSFTTGTAGPAETTLKITAPTVVATATSFTVKVALTSTVSSPAPTGTVTLTSTNGSGVTATLATLTAAQAFASGGYTATVSLPANGSYTLTATYVGDTNYKTSTTTATVVVAPMATLNISSASTYTIDDLLNITVTMSSLVSNTVPTGNVVVTLQKVGDGSGFFNQTAGTVSAAAAFASGGTLLSYKSYEIYGAYTITAKYAGDAVYPALTASIGINIQLRPSTLAISSAAAGVAGTPFNVGVSLNVLDSLLSDRGAVTVTAASTTAGGPTYTTLVTGLSAAKGATAALPIATPGTYRITASYNGDAYDLPSTSNTATVTITAASTALTITGPATTVANTAFNGVVSLKSTTITAVPTGRVVVTANFSDGTSNVLASSTAAEAFAAGGVTLSLSIDRVDNVSVVATYPGDANYPALVASFATVVAPQKTTLTLAGNTQGTVGQPYGTTVKLSGPGSTVKGDVTITATLNGSSAAPITRTVAAADAVFTTGSTIYLSFATAGTYTVTAHYAGDGAFAASDATALVVTVIPAPPSNFTLTLDEPALAKPETSLGISSGSAMTGITLTAVGGSGPGPVNLTVSNVDSTAYVLFRDPTTRKIITSATPVASGTHVLIEVGRSQNQPTALLRLNGFAEHDPISMAGGFGCLLGLAFLGFKRRSIRAMRTMYLMSAVCLIAWSGMMVAGCGDVTTQVLVTATPVTASKDAPPQSVTFYLTIHD